MKHLNLINGIGSRFMLSLALGLGASASAYAGTTTLTFEGLADGTILSNQYQPQGVIISGGVVFLTTGSFITAKSGVNVAYAPSGIATFTLDPAILGNVQTVSIAITGAPGVTLFAYDSSGVLLGQSVIPVGAGSNTVVSVTSSGTAIASVTIHDGGSTFFIDDVSFTSVDSCLVRSGNLSTAIAAIPDSAFRDRDDDRDNDRDNEFTRRRARLLKDAHEIQGLLALHAKTHRIAEEIEELQDQIESSLIKGQVRSSLLDLLNQLRKLEVGGSCQ